MILPLLAVAWLVAIATVAIWSAPPWVAAATVAALCPVVSLVRGRQATTLAVIAAAVALVGGVRFAAWNDRSIPDLSHYVGRNLSIEGLIVSEANPGSTTVSYRFAAEHVQVGDDRVITSGRLMATFDQYARKIHQPTNEWPLPLAIAPGRMLAKQGVVLQSVGIDVAHQTD